jgi:hypothetical protein
MIIPEATRFMALLEVEPLRPFVVEILSWISLDATGKNFFQRSGQEG